MTAGRTAQVLGASRLVPGWGQITKVRKLSRKWGTRPGGGPAPVHSDELVDDSKAPDGVPLWLCSMCSPGACQSATAV